MPTVKATLLRTKETFQNAGIDSPATDARILVQHVMNMTREQMFTQHGRTVSEAQKHELAGYVARRLKHEPVSRILGMRPFWKSVFKISKDTLDPRIDSETIVETVVKYGLPPDTTFLDLGTGSGCLLLSVLLDMPESSGIGVDISADAVKTATENAHNLGVFPRADFIVSDWNQVKFDRKFDAIISNPPYITADEMKALAPEVSLFDPERALFGGDDGLVCYRSIISLLPRLLKPKGHVFFEIGHKQAKAVKELLDTAGFTVLETAQDLAGNDRCIVAQPRNVTKVL